MKIRLEVLKKKGVTLCVGRDWNPKIRDFAPLRISGGAINSRTICIYYVRREYYHEKRGKGVCIYIYSVEGFGKWFWLFSKGENPTVLKEHYLPQTIKQRNKKNKLKISTFGLSSIYKLLISIFDFQYCNFYFKKLKIFNYIF